MRDTKDDTAGLCWYSIPTDPTQPWPKHAIAPGIHGAITPNGAGDLDGDGDLDVAAADTWYENKGKGASWTAHKNIPFSRVGPFGRCVRTAVVDMDKDSHLDLVILDADIVNCTGAIFLNKSGKGLEWTKVPLPQSFSYGSTHSLAVADFNNDGLLDIATNEQEELLPPGRQNPRWVIWMNQGNLKFTEHILLDDKRGGHELVAADYDRDGDIDLLSKPWSPAPWNAAAGQMHVDCLENLLKSPPP